MVAARFNTYVGVCVGKGHASQHKDTRVRLIETRGSRDWILLFEEGFYPVESLGVMFHVYQTLDPRGDTCQDMTLASSPSEVIQTPKIARKKENKKKTSLTLTGCPRHPRVGHCAGVYTVTIWSREIFLVWHHEQQASFCDPKLSSSISKFTLFPTTWISFLCVPFCPCLMGF